MINMERGQGFYVNNGKVIAKPVKFYINSTPDSVNGYYLVILLPVFLVDYCAFSNL